MEYGINTQETYSEVYYGIVMFGFKSCSSWYSLIKSRWSGIKLNFEFLILNFFDFRIQELDNGFFEKFGTLLKQQATKTESSAPQDGDSGVGDDVTPNVSIGDIDSEQEESDKANLITDAMGWNVSYIWIWYYLEGEVGKLL